MIYMNGLEYMIHELGYKRNQEWLCRVKCDDIYERFGVYDN